MLSIILSFVIIPASVALGISADRRGWFSSSEFWLLGVVTGGVVVGLLAYGLST